MNVIVCLDDNQGMLFNKRRQSRDRKVLEDIAEMTKLLWISPFSEKLFLESSCEVRMDELFLEKAEKGEFSFVENEEILPYIDKVEQIIVYKWNRKYPADFKFDVPLESWKLLEQKEFAGFSHEKITREVYVRG